MLTAISHERERAVAIERVTEYLRRHHLEPDDLLKLGGEDLADPDVRVRDRARSVERAWALLAELGLRFEILELHRGRGPAEDDRRSGMNAGRINSAI